eukprot:jgi/Mesen1/6573/ME000336S05791
MASDKPVEVVTGLDLQRYMGRWFEIASMPSTFQPKTGTNSRANYTLRPDGTVGVVNETWTNAVRASIEGKAWKVDAKSEEAKFIVQFWVPPFLPLFPVRGDYWVMALDKENYTYALVGQPSRKFLWVLSRTPQMADETYAKLMEVATEQGYDVSKLKKTEHPEGVVDGDGARKDDTHGFWWFRSMFGK